MKITVHIIETIGNKTTSKTARVDFGESVQEICSLETAEEICFERLRGIIKELRETEQPKP